MYPMYSQEYLKEHFKLRCVLINLYPSSIFPTLFCLQDFIKIVRLLLASGLHSIIG